jgi:hypothetical protein
MAEEFERLQEIGSFGLSCSIGFDILEADYGDGYDDSALVGSTEGTRGWQLVYKVLPGTMDSPVEVSDAELQSRADYLWNFFCRHKAGGNTSFTITCPRDGKDYLAKFVEHEMTYEMFAVKLFSTGLQLRQRRERGVATLDDSSLGESENTDRI